MSASTFTSRNSLAAKERTYTLEADAIRWTVDGEEGRLAYAEIVKLHLLRYVASRRLVLQCTLRDRAGEKVQFRSLHFQSLGMFDDRIAAYRPFTRELVRRVAERSPDAEFVRGSNMLFGLWLFMTVVFVGFLVLMLAIAFDAGGNAIGWAGVAICALFIYVGVNNLRRVGARRFDPANPPPDVLGQD